VHPPIVSRLHLVFDTWEGDDLVERFPTFLVTEPSPPVSDELWARVEDVRRSKIRGGGPKNWARVDLLAGLLECGCGR
jgi:hypothetical protein